MVTPSLINLVLWVSWFAYWVYSARSAARGKSLEPRRSRLVHLGAILLSLWLLLARPFELGAARKAEGVLVWPAAFLAAPLKQRLMDVPAAAKSEPC
jgi:hypothetical protein